MAQHRPSLRFAGCLAGFAALMIGGGWLIVERRDVGKELTASAQALLESLSAEQRAEAALDYADESRTDWHFIPKSRRKGLPLREMNAEQRKAARKLLQSALSQIGYDKASTIMQLERILHALEEKGTEEGRDSRRDHLRYYFTLFGHPADEGTWGLSIEGHHLSLNFVVADGRVVSHTPAFFGANPAEVRSDVGVGPKRGTRVLAKEEQLGFKLLESLSDAQRDRAVVDEKAQREVRGAGQPQPHDTPPVGLPVSQMEASQRETLLKLIRSYTENLPAPLAEEEWKEIDEAGIERIYFAWTGATRPGVGHSYRVQGPSFIIELCNTQPDAAGNPANHVHTLYRSTRGDFHLPR